MSPGRKCSSIGFRLFDDEITAFNAFAERFVNYDRGELIRLALARYIRENGMSWPAMDRLDNEPHPLKPPKPAPPAPKTKRGDRA
jgi:lactate dehydrogenase-like 2-hydroxyacid dehydrogenase